MDYPFFMDVLWALRRSARSGFIRFPLDDLAERLELIWPQLLGRSDRFAQLEFLLCELIQARLVPTERVPAGMNLAKKIVFVGHGIATSTP